jgi:hypothetical protein
VVEGTICKVYFCEYTILYEVQEIHQSDEVKLLLMEKGIGIGNRFEDQAERFICAL